MQNRQDLKSILPFLPPLKLKSSGTLTWLNTQVTDTLQSISHGCQLDSGKKLFDAISTIRNSLCLPSEDPLAESTGKGFSIFFEELLPVEQSKNWLHQVIPRMADLILSLPSLLENHYGNCDNLIDGVSTGLRILEPQQPGVVFLSQELIAALLSCAFFCLFPTVNRMANCMPLINMDEIFASIHDRYHPKQENKIKCIIHYFERICSSTPSNFVSFERKVLSTNHNPSVVALPSYDLWANSVAPLCEFKVFPTGLIEDHPAGALEVDFADPSFGGIVLTMGCLQEEIRFMMNPELIVGMLFLPSMADNEAIEIVGAERFSNYKGYNSTFQYDGDHVDRRGLDRFHRRMSRIIAIDASAMPGTNQYRSKFLMREVNKAFCGFLNHPHYQTQECDSNAGVATGNWGCGVFGGDPEIKSILQWLAASQASRSFISYYTFGLETLQILDQVVVEIVSQKWTVGDLWNRLSDYCLNRLDGQTKFGFFKYLIPSIEQDDSGSSTYYKRIGANESEFSGVLWSSKNAGTRGGDH
ncbi:unnamed protein product [Amaranthus hypochondriacus]